MEKKTQTFTNIPECLVQPAPHKYETVQEILIFLRLAYFVPNKIWLKKKKKKAPNAHTHKKKTQVTSLCFSLASLGHKIFSCSLLQHYCISSGL